MRMFNIKKEDDNKKMTIILVTGLIKFATLEYNTYKF